MAREVARTQVTLNAPIKSIGQYKVPLALHPEVETNVTVIVARSAQEAERIGRGEDVTIRRTDAEEEAAATLANAEAFFEPEAAKALREGEQGEGDPEAERRSSARGRRQEAGQGRAQEERKS